MYNESLTDSVQWKKDVDQYHSVGDLQLEDNQVVVPLTGLYFVYSQASFRLDCQAEKLQRQPEMVLTYMVERWSDSYDDFATILHSGRTACQQAPRGGKVAKGKWFSAVYVGAVFKMNKGDRLRTVVDEKFLPSVDSGDGKTFFGVFAL